MGWFVFSLISAVALAFLCARFFRGVPDANFSALNIDLRQSMFGLFFFAVGLSLSWTVSGMAIKAWPNGGVFAGMLATHVIMLGSLWLFSLFADVKLALFKGFSLDNAEYIVRKSVRTAGVCLVLSFGLMASLAKFTEQLCIWITGNVPEQQTVVEFFKKIENPWLFGVAVFSVGIVAPIAEELFFRGVLYRWFMSRAGRYSAFYAVIGSAAAFSAVHMSIFAALPIFSLGVILALAYRKTGSILTCIFIHSGINILNMVALLVAD